MLPIDLSGKIAVVTGASGQLGRVLARTLARCGADVALHYFRHPDAARSLCEALQALGVRGMMVQADITQPESIQAMRAAIMRTLGAPHILVPHPLLILGYSRFNFVRASSILNCQSTPRCLALVLSAQSPISDWSKGSSPMRRSVRH